MTRLRTQVIAMLLVATATATASEQGTVVLLADRSGGSGSDEVETALRSDLRDLGVSVVSMSLAPGTDRAARRDAAMTVARARAPLAVIAYAAGEKHLHLIYHGADGGLAEQTRPLPEGVGAGSAAEMIAVIVRELAAALLLNPAPVAAAPSGSEPEPSGQAPAGQADAGATGRGGASPTRGREARGDGGGASVRVRGRAPRAARSEPLRASAAYLLALAASDTAPLHGVGLDLQVQLPLGLALFGGYGFFPPARHTLSLDGASAVEGGIAMSLRLIQHQVSLGAGATVRLGRAGLLARVGVRAAYLGAAAVAADSALAPRSAQQALQMSVPVSLTGFISLPGRLRLFAAATMDVLLNRGVFTAVTASGSRLVYLKPWRLQPQFSVGISASLF